MNVKLILIYCLKFIVNLIQNPYSLFYRCGFGSFNIFIQSVTD